MPGLPVHRAADLPALARVGLGSHRAGQHAFGDHLVKQVRRHGLDRVRVDDIAVLFPLGGRVVLVLLELVGVSAGQGQQAEAAQPAQALLAAALLGLVRHDAHEAVVAPFADLRGGEGPCFPQQRPHPEMSQLLVILLQPCQDGMVDDVHNNKQSFRIYNFIHSVVKRRLIRP